MSVDKETVLRVARLARVGIEPERVEPMANELSRILGWVDQLSEVATDGVEPLASVSGHSLPFRDDVVEDGDRVDDVMANAPESISGFFAVPKVVE